MGTTSCILTADVLMHFEGLSVAHALQERLVSGAVLTRVYHFIYAVPSSNQVQILGPEPDQMQI